MKRNSKIERVKGRLENEPVILINVYTSPESNKYFLKLLFDVTAVETEGTLIWGRGGD